MSAPQFRAAIVGCGRIAGIKDTPRGSGGVTTHAQAYHRHPAFRVVAACDADGARLAAFQERWGVQRGFTALQPLLAETRLDVVSVCSPTEEHYRQTQQLLECSSAPRVIFVEKPVCESPPELDTLDRLVQRSHVAVLVNHTRRFDAAHRRAAALIARGELGALVAGRCDYYGGWLHNGSHTIDTLRMLLHGEPSIDRIEPGAPGKPNDPCWNVRLRCGDAPVDVMSVDARHYQLWEIDLRFERGRILLRDFGAQIVVEAVHVNDLDERVLLPLPDSPWAGLDAPLYHAVNAIARHLQGEADLAQTGATLDSARRTMRLLWQAREVVSKL